MISVTTWPDRTYVLARYLDAVYAEPVGRMTVGANVKRIRKAAGFKTQAALARAMGIPQPRVSDIENDRYERPDTKTLLAYATALGCSLGDLLEGVDGYEEERPAAPTTAPPAVAAPEPTPSQVEAAKLVARIDLLDKKIQPLAWRGVHQSLDELEAVVRAYGDRGSAGESTSAHRGAGQRTKRSQSRH